MTTKIKLTKPLNDGKITELEIAEPTLGQLARCGGLPFTADGIDFEKALPLLEASTGVQAPFLKELCGRDGIKAVNELAKLLIEDEDGVKN